MFEFVADNSNPVVWLLTQLGHDCRKEAKVWNTCSGAMLIKDKKSMYICMLVIYQVPEMSRLVLFRSILQSKDYNTKDFNST